MITVKDLTFGYLNGKLIFKNFNWHVSDASHWAIIGPSGCGKTTLLYLLSGLYRPLNGHILIKGRKIKSPDSSIGLILQDYGLLPWYTVWDNVALGLRLQKLDNNVIKQRVDKWLNFFGISSKTARYPFELSGGERQRVAIARTLVLNPDLILMDEPFASLDALTREKMQKMIIDFWQKKKIMTILVTHNIEEAVLLGQHILIMPSPPIDKAKIIDNPNGGKINFRRSQKYYCLCQAIRKILKLWS